MINSKEKGRKILKLNKSPVEQQKVVKQEGSSCIPSNSSKTLLRTPKNDIDYGGVISKNNPANEIQETTARENPHLKEKNQAFYNSMLEVYQPLNRKFPNVINRNNIKMLATGIHKEIAAELNISLTKARLFCKWYCSINYKKAMVEGAKRYNLQGKIVGEVTKEQIDYLKKFLKMIKN